MSTEIETLVSQFIEDRDSNYCHASFDYCFNYFQSFENKADLAAPENLEKSCLHLGYFLASWGMFRSPKLAKKTSLTHYSKIIQEIANWDGQNRFATIWKIDANKYNIDKTRKLLIECYEKLKEIARPAEQKADLTLTTKIMLGIFGCIPGFDIKVQKTFEIKFPQKFTIKKFDRALEKLGSFYNGHKVVIDKLAKQTKTLDFATGKKTRKCYTRAKIIDMIGFQKAEKKNKR